MNHTPDAYIMNFDHTGQWEYRLLYNNHCRPCRVLSILVVIFSLGAVRRIPIDSVETAEIRRERPEWGGQLMLIDRDRVWLAGEVFRAVPRAIAQIYWRRFAPLIGQRCFTKGVPSS